MSHPVRVMLEMGKKKRVVACAFDWPGWDRSAKSESGALETLDAYRGRYAKVVRLAGLGDAFAEGGALDIVERVAGNGMTDYYGVSGRPATLELEPMTEAESERKLALLEAAWTYFDDVASRVSAELRTGPRGGGRNRDRIVRHTNGAEIEEFAVKVGVKTDPEVWQSRLDPWPHRRAFAEALRDYSRRGAAARTWPLQFLIRRCAWHMLDHAWEMEDKDLSGNSRGQPEGEMQRGHEGVRAD